MFKVIKFRILTILEDKKFFALLALIFLVNNYRILFSGLVLKGGNPSTLVKYALLMNNFSMYTFLFFCVLAIYVGAGLIGKDIRSNQIYLILSVYSNRAKYLIANWIGLSVILFATIITVVANLFIFSVVLSIPLIFSDILIVYSRMLLSGIVLMTITSMASIIIKGMGSITTGILALVNYNIYTLNKIPIIDEPVYLSESVRRLLCNLSPVSLPPVPSLLEKTINNLPITVDNTVTPYIINNITIYQLIYCIALLIVGVLLFTKKEI